MANKFMYTASGGSAGNHGSVSHRGVGVLFDPNRPAQRSAYRRPLLLSSFEPSGPASVNSLWQRRRA